MSFGVDVRGKVWPQMKAIVAQLFTLVGPEKLNPRGRQFCFELLGLDFMIDAVGQVGRNMGRPHLLCGGLCGSR